MINYEEPIKCKCGEWAEPDEFILDGFQVHGWKCKSCNEAYYNLEELEPLLLINKLKKQKLKGKVTKDGNSIAIRIPKKIADALKLHIGDTVNISIETLDQITITINH